MENRYDMFSLLVGFGFGFAVFLLIRNIVVTTVILHFDRKLRINYSEQEKMV